MDPVNLQHFIILHANLFLVRISVFSNPLKTLYCENWPLPLGICLTMLNWCILWKRLKRKPPRFAWRWYVTAYVVPSRYMQVSEKLKLAEKTAKEIEILRDGYRPAARRGAVLFFVLSGMAAINSMYQYSLNSYLQACTCYRSILCSYTYLTVEYMDRFLITHYGGVCQISILPRGSITSSTHWVWMYIIMPAQVRKKLQKIIIV